MSPEVINLYIEKLLNEINELTKSKLLISTQNAYLEMINASLHDQLREANEKLEANLNKKASKPKEDF
jgi:regulator of replication initiation timing